jgi:hypothetical protein
MSNHPDKQSRKDKLHEWRARQRAAARAKLPLPDGQMRAMCDMLDFELPKRGSSGRQARPVSVGPFSRSW